MSEKGEGRGARGEGRASPYRVKFDETCFRPLEDRKAQLASSKTPFTVSLSADQEIAYKAVKKWRSSKSSSLLTLGGYAGTGKSTLVSLFASEHRALRIAFVALTGRAANNLRQKMLKLGVSSSSHFVMTLHSLLYQCFQTDDGRLRWQTKGRTAFGQFDLIVIDEASMVHDAMLKDLLQFGVPIWAVGDHGQLPPVAGTGKLMQTPNLRLEMIHRQAEGSAIIQISKAIRETGDMPKTPPGSGEVRYLRKADLREVAATWYGERKIEDVAFLAWKNSTRVLTNGTLRAIRWGEPCPIGGLPRPGEQVLCLKNAKKLAFNGMRGFLDTYAETTDGGYLDGDVRFPDENLGFRGSVSRVFFDREKMPETFVELEKDGVFVEEWDELGLLLDYGYCLTVHKAQGSQFDSVGVVREKVMSATPEMFKRWLYTAVTRAQERLIVFV